jgi:anion-transporting  ArsA/GET3 family ATPase
MAERLDALLDSRKIVLCVGGGGVGKTTISAAIALAAALRGRKVAVLTIDPAKRLKDALGLADLGAEPRAVPIAALGGRPGGSLTATMLDAKRTFDELVARFAPSLDAAERILSNRLYQFVSGRLAGSQEYMALEKLYEIATANEYDLIVVDTPPTHHALDFLDAPRRMIDLLSSRAISILRSPSSMLFGAGSRIAQDRVERMTGLSLLAEVADFLASFESMLGGFRDRADAVRRILRDPSTAAVMVTSAEPLTVGEAVAFYRELEGAGLALGGVVLNRTVPASLLERRHGHATEIAPPLLKKLREARRELDLLADRDRRMDAELRAALGGTAPVVAVPALARDVRTLDDLRELAARLAAPPPPSNVRPFPVREAVRP